MSSKDTASTQSSSSSLGGLSAPPSRRNSSTNMNTSTISESKTSETPLANTINTSVGSPSSIASPTSIESLAATVAQQGAQQQQMMSLLSTLTAVIQQQAKTVVMENTSSPSPMPPSSSSLSPPNPIQAQRHASIEANVNATKRDVLGASDGDVALAKQFLSGEVSGIDETNIATDALQIPSSFPFPSSASNSIAAPSIPSSTTTAPYGLSSTLFPTDVLQEGKTLLSILTETLSSKTTTSASKDKFKSYELLQTVIRSEFLKLSASVKSATGSAVPAAMERVDQWVNYSLFLS